MTDSNTATGDRPIGQEPPVPWLVWSHEHNGFWAPGRWGYTRFIEQAGRFSRDEAEAICRDAQPSSWRDRDTPDLPPEICFPAPEAVDQLAGQVPA